VPRWKHHDIRFTELLIVEEECWRWLGFVTEDGYGNFSRGGRRVLAHRFAYERFIGPIPAGLQIDHLCRNTLCVNPNHLEAVTHQENSRRTRGLRRTKTHCPSGHEYTPDNTGWYDDYRYCRTCNRAGSARQYLRRKAMARAEGAE
jgi:hypothetical protein